jgi:hypothetical protein
VVSDCHKSIKDRCPGDILILLDQNQEFAVFLGFYILYMQDNEQSIEILFAGKDLLAEAATTGSRISWPEEGGSTFRHLST